MSDEDRILWDAGDAVIRPPTPDEVSALGAQLWTPPRTPPPFARPSEGPVILRDGDLGAEIVEHGELGPLLVNADHHFTSEEDLS